MRPGASVGLVLGAGGVAGHAFHAGVLTALHEATGWDPRDAEIVVGTSAGSVLGAGLRAGIPPADILARSLDEPASPDTEELLDAVPERDDHYPIVDGAGLPLPEAPGLAARLVLTPRHLRLGLVTAALLPEGRRDPSSIGADLDHILTHRSIDRPFWVTAVRLADGARVVFGRDDTPPPGTWSWGQAVTASCAIPGFFAPVEIAGERYVDGGAYSTTSADLLAGLGLDVVVVSAPMSSVRSAAFRSVDAPFRAIHRLRLAREVAKVTSAGTEVVVFQPTPADLAVMGLNAMDPSRRADVARRAYASARARFERNPSGLPTIT